MKGCILGTGPSLDVFAKAAKFQAGSHSKELIGEKGIQSGKKKYAIIPGYWNRQQEKNS